MNLDKADQLHELAPYKLVQLDSGAEDSILKAAEALKDEKIDVLINNAGIGSDEDLEGTTKASLLIIKPLTVRPVWPRSSTS
ncbi:hypothetical protein Poli38472_001131 [Pythium oligandrum]|uniref:Uncharacterized protein n=1 Tax=Pythium oligandrum TaxID=41045 RepID=A0A8K1CUM3_PYTOL|nr:hypothetical protein Poli38472_001131 [Pythium oligandrum]|eukprot:TMW68975.1 hypothetical protein Poli38472_001131 [Pythium oligandrum]